MKHAILDVIIHIAFVIGICSGCSGQVEYYEDDMALNRSRNTTYAVDTEVKSADLNAIQDELIYGRGSLRGIDATGGAIAASQPVPMLTTFDYNSGPFVASDSGPLGVTRAPRAGIYRVTFCIACSATSSFYGLEMRKKLSGGGHAVIKDFKRVPNSSGDIIDICGLAYVEIEESEVSYAGPYLVNSTTGGTPALTLSGGWVSVEQFAGAPVP